MPAVCDRMRRAMNRLDLILVGIMLAFAGIGALRGVLRESFSVAAWGLAALMAWLFSASAAIWFVRLGDPMISRMLGFVAVFVGVFLLVSVATFMLRLLLGPAVPGTKARVAGALLGAARGVLILVIVVLLAGLTSLPKKPLWQGSEFIVYFQSMALAMRDILPEDVARQFRYG